MSPLSNFKNREFTFTHKRLQELKSPDSGRDEYRDTKVAGLTIRVTKKNRVFYFRRWSDGSMKRIKLGSFPEMSVDTARTQASEVQGKLHAGIDVAGERRVRRSCPTLGQAFDFYLDSYAKQRKRTWRQDKTQFDRYIEPSLKSRKLNTIRKSDIATLHTEIGKKGIYAANRLRSLLVKIWQVAIDAELFPGPNPCLSVKPFKEKSRDRFLDAEELKRFFKALKEEPHEIIRDYLYLSLLIGARKSNMLSMAWDDIDWQHALWKIPETKRGEPQIVPLSQGAIEVLRRRWDARKEGCPWVFPSTGNRPSRSGHLMSPQKQWEDIIKRAKLDGVRLHDLRRTLGSWMAMLGTSEIIIGRSLGHAPGSKATRVYAQLQDGPVRQSVEQATVAMQQAAGLIEGKTIDIEAEGKEG